MKFFGKIIDISIWTNIIKDIPNNHLNFENFVSNYYLFLNFIILNKFKLIYHNQTISLYVTKGYLQRLRLGPIAGFMSDEDAEYVRRMRVDDYLLRLRTAVIKDKPSNLSVFVENYARQKIQE